MELRQSDPAVFIPNSSPMANNEIIIRNPSLNRSMHVKEFIDRENWYRGSLTCPDLSRYMIA
jgi:hypothetical protein